MLRAVTPPFSLITTHRQNAEPPAGIVGILLLSPKQPAMREAGGDWLLGQLHGAAAIWRGARQWIDFSWITQLPPVISARCGRRSRSANPFHSLQTSAHGSQ